MILRLNILLPALWGLGLLLIITGLSIGSTFPIVIGSVLCVSFIYFLLQPIIRKGRPHSKIRIPSPISFIVLLPISLLIISLLIDLILTSTVSPPENLKTIEDFKEWKQGSKKRMGTFEHAGETYTVILAPSGRWLASGPAAYLFDKNGAFVDWTPDMGDAYTVKYKFDLTSGNVKNINWNNP